MEGYLVFSLLLYTLTCGRDKYSFEEKKISLAYGCSITKHWVVYLFLYIKKKSWRIGRRV
jgi:hypothetical protein